MALDFLEDLFADFQDDDSLTDTLSNKTFSSPSSDSGHGSPLSYEENSFTNSPETLTWDTDMNNDLWGSLLDDLPAELSSNESDNNDQYNLNDEPLNWTNNIFENTSDVMEKSLNTKYELNTNNLSNEDFLNIKDEPMVSMDDIVNNHNDIQIVEPKPVKIVKANTSLSAQQKPIILKPIAVIKGSDQLGDLRSHIKIGNNIFAIIQNSDNTNTLQTITSTVTSVSTPKNTVPSAPNNVQVVDLTSRPAKRPHTSLDEHDYADEEDHDSFETTGVSKGFGPGLELTDEEKKLLDLENIIIPEDAPLTKEEEKALKKVRRKIKNKQSAMDSRRRRKEYIGNLERRVKHCTDANNGLKKKVDKLTQDNKNLLVQLKRLQAVVASSVQSNKTAQKGTCLAVLLLSFALFYLPFNPMHANAAGKTEVLNAKAAAPTFRSRALLSIDDSTHEYHDNNESVNAAALYRDNELDNLNDSLVYTEEMKEKLEKLLISEDHDIALTKLQEYMNAGGVAVNFKNSLERANSVVDDDQHVNIIEVREEYLTTAAANGKFKNNEI